MYPSECNYFFLHYPPTTAIYTLSLHDALPISPVLLERQVDLGAGHALQQQLALLFRELVPRRVLVDRKSTRLNSSHVKISYAVFCLKKKKNKQTQAD